MHFKIKNKHACRVQMNDVALQSDFERFLFHSLFPGAAGFGSQSGSGEM